jgi:hypothetical protein
MIERWYYDKNEKEWTEYYLVKSRYRVEVWDSKNGGKFHYRKEYLLYDISANELHETSAYQVDFPLYYMPRHGWRKVG